MRWGRVTRRVRPQIERFLRHPSVRVREYAAQILEADRAERAEFRRMLEEEARLVDLAFEEEEEALSAPSDEAGLQPSDDELGSDAFLVVEDFGRH